MTQLPLRVALVSLLCPFAAGCTLLSKKAGEPKAPKESTAISADVERNFRQRWVEKRRGELAAQGLAAEAAAAQADREFSERYDFGARAKK